MSPRARATDESRRYAAIAARAAEDKKGDAPVVLGVAEVLGICDWFVITSAANTRQVRTIAEEVEKQIKEHGGPAPQSVEGLGDARWILLDYGDVVVHVFLDEARTYYDLERLWADADRLDWVAAVGE